MLRSRFVFVWVVTWALVLSIALPSVAAAQSTMPMEIQPGVWSPVHNAGPIWFSFAVGNLDEDLLSEVTIRLEGRPIHGASFEVFSDGDWTYWGPHDTEDWFGVSTESKAGDALWVGSLPAGGYFVHVDPMGAKEILLTISGSVVYDCECMDLHYQPKDTFTVAPQPAVAAPQSVAVAPKPATPAPVMTLAATPKVAPAPAMPEITGATMAMSPGVWMANDDNQPHWFTFYVDRIEDQITNHVNISIDAVPVAGGEFQIFDSVGGNYWGQPEPDSWIGASSVQEDGSISWSGDLTAGAYYIRMEPGGVQSCLLAISGEAITY